MTWHYSNTSVQTTLSAPVAPGDTSITIVDTSGLPVTFPFSLTLDYQLSTAEVVTVTNLVGSTLTVTRGQDGTSAQSHSSGGPVAHGVVARDVQEPQDHIASSQNIHGVGSGNAVVGTDTTQTLTNKTVSGSSNTLTNIGDTSLTGISASKVTGTFSNLVLNGSALKVTESGGGISALEINASGDTNPRFQVTSDGIVRWGPGNTATDFSAFRNAPGELALTGGILVTRNTGLTGWRIARTGDTTSRVSATSDGVLQFGSGSAASDTNLYRAGAGVLKTDGDIQVVGKIVADVSGAAETWHPLVLQNGWTNIGGFDVTAQYRKVASPANCVHIVGDIHPGTKTDTTVIANLPVGYRPAHNQIFPVSIDVLPTGRTAQVVIFASGDITIIGVNTANLSYLNLGGIILSLDA